MTLSEFESLLQYINRLHNPENPGLHNDTLEGYVPKMVSDVTCKIGLHKSDVPAGRVSRIDFVLNTGESKSFDVSECDFHRKHSTRIKMWLLVGSEDPDWYAMTMYDCERRSKFLKQIKAYAELHGVCIPDKFRAYTVQEFMRDFLGSVDEDPFYMSDKELFQSLEAYLSV